MARSHLTLRQLEIFLAAVELGSFRRAGETLNLSPVVVGEHMRTLESRLGGPLFVRRSGSRPILTELGERIVQRATDVMAAVNRLENEAVPRNDEGQWKFAILPFMGRHLAGRIVELRQRFAESQIVTIVRDEPVGDMLDKVTSGECKLAMTIVAEQSLPVVPANVEIRVIIDEPVAFFVSRDHPLADRRKVTVAEIQRFAMASLPPRHPLRTVVDAVLASAGFTQYRSALETDDYNLILNDISRGSTIGCLFAEVTSSDAVAHRLQMLDIGFHLPTPQAIMLVNRTASADRRLAVAADFLANHYRFDAAVTRTRVEVLDAM